MVLFVLPSMKVEEVQAASGGYDWGKFRVIGYDYQTSGSAVRGLQSFLYATEYNSIKFDQSGGIDGVFGQTTYTVLRDFQSKNSLVVDGIAGAATWKKFKQKSWWINSYTLNYHDSLTNLHVYVNELDQSNIHYRLEACPPVSGSCTLLSSGKIHP
ncbi:peptidoglycan-binding protein [Sporosarcina sp. Sa2YVA2]|uniref:Peptidoglycan-binding protein n=2 Tax=Sporosarcina quadrami TaxID=2762234 RepID=A0ABR8U7V3_9BACL|nr:peptidoglycan-binding protein [Sporosarcina quadrami]